MKWPFIKFYPRDWLGDTELRMCSLGARGYWMECLCIMHSAKRRGFMESPQGVPLDEKQRSRLTGTFIDDLYRYESELLEHGVPSVDEETGVWYCRRMVKETAKSEKCSASGKKGGGNPSLNKENDKEDIPEARSHISLKVTFKGAPATAIQMVEEVLNCRPEFSKLNPEPFFRAISDTKDNPRQKINHQEFIADMSNSLRLPNNPAKKYAAFLNSEGKPSSKSKAGEATI